MTDLSEFGKRPSPEDNVLLDTCRFQEGEGATVSQGLEIALAVERQEQCAPADAGVHYALFVTRLDTSTSLLVPSSRRSYAHLIK